jgi:TRAP-type C4-dicarboxylate transport system substrate-binding protein
MAFMDRMRITMITRLARLALAIALLPSAAIAQPATLKLAFFTSDRSSIYERSVKPFIDAVNQEAKGLLEIEVELPTSLLWSPDTRRNSFRTIRYLNCPACSAT